MRAPKGFAKNYFTLSAIQAHSTQPLLQQVHSRVDAYCLQLAQEDDTVLEEDDPQQLIECAATSLPIQGSGHSVFSRALHQRGALHCNCHFYTLTRNLIYLNPKAKRQITLWRLTNSTLSPPLSVV